MKHEHKLVNKYISRYWDKPFDEISGYKILNDIKNVFGYDDKIAKHVIIEWFKGETFK
jgi:hypothetical protein